jgi:hypothetical protein
MQPYLYGGMDLVLAGDTRGIPFPLSDEAWRSIRLKVEDALFDGDTEDVFGAVSRATADRWIASGRSRYLPTPDGQSISDCILSPDVSFPNWLTVAEFRQIVSNQGFRLDAEDTGLGYDLSPQYRELLHSMESLDARLGAGRTRLFYWFDH